MFNQLTQKFLEIYDFIRLILISLFIVYFIPELKPIVIEKFHYYISYKIQ